MKHSFLKQLEQRMEVRQGQQRQRVEAKFEGDDNKTTNRVNDPKRETKVV